MSGAGEEYIARELWRQLSKKKLTGCTFNASIYLWEIDAVYSGEYNVGSFTSGNPIYN
jgi:hypothetical protein